MWYLKEARASLPDGVATPPRESVSDGPYGRQNQPEIGPRSNPLSVPRHRFHLQVAAGRPPALMPSCENQKWERMVRYRQNERIMLIAKSDRN